MESIMFRQIGDFTVSLYQCCLDSQLVIKKQRESYTDGYGFVDDSICLGSCDTDCIVEIHEGVSRDSANAALRKAFFAVQITSDDHAYCRSIEEGACTEQMEAAYGDKCVRAACTYCCP